MKLLLDMNLSPRWVEVLRDAELNAQHWFHVGNPSATDVEVFAWALENDYIVLPHDLDFGRLLALTAARGPSVVQLRTHRILPAKAAEQLIAVLRKHEDLLRRGALVTIEADRSRARLLPLA